MTKRETKTKTKRETKTKTKTRKEKDSTCAILSESRGCMYIKYEYEKKIQI